MVNNCKTIKYVSNYIKAGRSADSHRVEKCDRENELIIDDIINEIRKK